MTELGEIEQSVDSTVWHAECTRSDARANRNPYSPPRHALLCRKKDLSQRELSQQVWVWHSLKERVKPYQRQIECLKLTVFLAAISYWQSCHSNLHNVKCLHY